MKSFGALYKTAGVLLTTAQLLGNKILAWTAAGVTRSGDLSVIEDTTNSRLTAGTDGAFRVAAQASLQTDDVSGTSGDDAGDVYIQVFKNGVAVPSLKAGANFSDSGLMASVTIPPMPIALAKGDYVELFLVSADASGNDVLIKEAQLSLELIG